jgi:hypothetical protein
VRIGLDDRVTVVRLLSWSRKRYPLRNAQIASVSSSLGSGDLFPEIKCQGCEADHLSASSAVVSN